MLNCFTLSKPKPNTELTSNTTSPHLKNFICTSCQHGNIIVSIQANFKLNRRTIRKHVEA